MEHAMTLQFGWWDHFEQRDDMPLWQQYDERIELIQRAEQHGFYGYHIAEHHFTTLDMAPSPIVFLAAVARRTSRIRLGTMVLCLPLYHPTRLMQEICMIDQLSHGRFMPGVGRGVRDVEHEWFGSDTQQTRDAYDEVLAVLLQALGTGRITHHGQRFHYDDVPVRFTMVQQPYPRFWYAGNLQRAAEQGMNALGRVTREQVEQYWQIWQAGRDRHDPRFLGDDPIIASTRHIVVADSDAEALSLARRAFRAYAEHFHATEVRVGGGLPSFGALPRPGGTNADEMIEAGHVLAGSPSTVRDRLRRFVDDVGPKHNYLVAAYQWGDLTTEEAVRSLDLFACEVKPALA
jgi:alkanesulfonate monooxygenase SsuD/methylene tetrahydromethanopterin reductase-like flavin-dependent oxidoreductase (luciferase family)